MAVAYEEVKAINPRMIAPSDYFDSMDGLFEMEADEMFAGGLIVHPAEELTNEEIDRMSMEEFAISVGLAI